MQLNRPYRQPTITSFLKKQSNLDFSQMLKKYEMKNNGPNTNTKNGSRLYPFAYQSPSMSLIQTPLKHHNNANIKSPSPCTMLSNLDLQNQNHVPYTNSSSKKRKLEEHDRASNKTNCLKKVILSDGSVCYTMVSQQQQSSLSSSCTPSQPPLKRMRPNSCSQPETLPLSQPPTKKRKAASCRSSRNRNGSQMNQIHSHKKTDHLGNTKGNKAIVYSVSMPSLHQASNQNKKRRRRHSHNEHWTSNNNLLASLQQQESISEEIFPSQVPKVNLEEMFNGQQFIRVHKKIRPINLRRETQMFAQPQL
eukprot:74809_1